MTKSTFGAPVTLTTNEYIAPSDGYLHVAVNTNSYIHVLVNDVFNHNANGNTNSSASSGLYVRKGMTLKITASGGTASAEFIPFN